MIPTIPESALPDTSLLEIATPPSRTYELDLSSKRILGKVDGLSAVTQMAYKTLYTERYAWLIYNWDYGMELEQYLGKDFEFIKADITIAVTEALMVDDRVLDVRDFKIEKVRIDAFYLEFTVVSTEGTATIKTEVPL